MTTTSKHTAEHYTWGEGCDGWHLLKSENLSVIQEAMPPHTAEVAHSHRHSRQFFYVLSGALSIELADGTTLLSSGEGLHIAPDVMHRVVNSAETPVQFLVISAPPSHGDRILAPRKKKTMTISRRNLLRHTLGFGMLAAVGGGKAQAATAPVEVKLDDLHAELYGEDK